MSAAVDANVLLYGSDSRSPRHRAALERLQQFAAGPELLYVFWPVAMAYLRIATHPGVFEHPLDPNRARSNLAGLIDRPHVRCPGERDGFWSVFQRTVSDTVVRGNLVTDAHLVALMRQNDVQTIWTTDRDFRRFDGITVADPFG